MRYLIQVIKIGAIAIIAGFVLLGARAAFNAASEDAPKPVNELVTVTITINESTDDIAADFKAKGLLTSTEYFRLYVLVNRAGDKIKAGTYAIPKGLSTGQLVERITGETAAVQQSPSVTVRIPEGSRIEQIPALLREAGMLTAANDFLATAKSGTFEYDFLRDRPMGQPGQPTLEGYLFPDTYRFTLDATANTTIRAMLDNYGRRYAQARDALPAEARTKGPPSGATNFYQVLVVASIVEREAASDADRGEIAAVYYNRLKQGVTLDADPTVQYALGTDAMWWRKITGDETKSTMSPYNTYLNRGLPPTPICSPSLKSIQAALNPPASDNVFFVAKNDGTGTHAFARDLDTHNANVARYVSNLNATARAATAAPAPMPTTAPGATPPAATRRP